MEKNSRDTLSGKIKKSVLQETINSFVEKRSSSKYTAREEPHIRLRAIGNEGDINGSTTRMHYLLCAYFTANWR